MLRSETIIATPPGVTIKEQLQNRKMTQKEFAIRMGLSEKHVSHLMNGKVQLTQEVAYRLELVLGVPASFWNNLEAIYREKLIRIEHEKDLEEDKLLLSQFPYKEMEENGWLSPSETEEEQVTELRKFFGVSKIQIILENQLSEAGIPFYNSTNNLTQLSWNQKARNEAEARNVQNFKQFNLKDCLTLVNDIRQHPSNNFQEKLIQTLGNFGIILIFLPPINGLPNFGTTFKDRKHYIIAMPLPVESSPPFWEDLFQQLNSIPQVA